MKLDAFLILLRDNPSRTIGLILPDRSAVPAHFHVTEVGRVRKDFIDCGGTARSWTMCVLQVWVANDKDHRLDTTKLLKIMNLAEPLFNDPGISIEIEYEGSVLSQYPVSTSEVNSSGVVLHLGGKHTACLAPDRCGLDIVNSSCCSATDCC